LASHQHNGIGVSSRTRLNNIVKVIGIEILTASTYP